MKLVVVGGGVSALAAAHRAVELARERRVDLDVRVVEARRRLGGPIATERADGFLVEAGPDSFLSEKPWALALCRRLGVEDRLVRTDDRFRKVFVWFRGRLHPLPDGFQLLAPTRLAPFATSSLFSWRGKARMALDLVLPRGGGALGGGDDESLGAFVRRRLGGEALERVAQPLVAGIYTADPEELSVAATMPRFVEVERRHRSVILGLRRGLAQAPLSGTSGARWSLFVTFADGMETLVTTLADRLPDSAVVLGQRVAAVERVGTGWRVTSADGARFEADRVILAAEAHVAARLLRYVDPALATLLGEIEYAGAATVSLGYRRADVPHPLDGFGFVVPRSEGKALLAATFSSVKYPGRAPEGSVLIRCFMGGALNAALLDEDDARLVARARRELGEALGVTAEPRLVRASRWPASMPQYRVGHLARVEAIERCAAGLPGLYLAGAAYRGVGIADSVRSGEAAAEATLG
ncbi:MAG TPA: protoporphyrinogen oxidase [Patescibacteria group bacterium]|nr:protoporphyrinogen oxidase [Patescibacteria group bacterium]